MTHLHILDKFKSSASSVEQQQQVGRPTPQYTLLHAAQLMDNNNNTNKLESTHRAHTSKKLNNILVKQSLGVICFYERKIALSISRVYITIYIC